MSIRRIGGVRSGLLLLGGLVAALPGCGGGPGQPAGPAPGKEVQIVHPADAKPDNPPVSEEYKNLSPAGKAGGK
jgi:hypothetical protein